MMRFFISFLMTSILFCGCVSTKLSRKHDISGKVVELIKDIEASQKNMCDRLSKSDIEHITPACNSISDPFWNSLRSILIGQAPKLDRMITNPSSTVDPIIYFRISFSNETGEATCTIWNDRQGLHCFDIYPDGVKPRFVSIWGARMFSRLLGDEYLEKIEGIDFQGEKKNHHDLYPTGGSYSILTKIKVNPGGELEVIGSVLT